MGGRGSGRQSGLGLMVDKCHEFHAIDIAWLRRKRLLQTGHWSTLRWSRGGHETGNVRFECLAGGIRLVYRHRKGGGEWQDVNEIVPLIETTTRFNGRRQWFRCLSCGKRCRILYGGSYFRCRRCHCLKYDTQYEPPFCRAATRALKIRERLGSAGGIDDPFPAKPKRMHWRTYERLQRQEEQLQSAWAVGIMAKWKVFERPEDD